mgnify:CR=1 FL=1
MIPLASPFQQYAIYKDQIEAAIKKVLSRGYYILGEEVENFEKEFADYISSKSAITCNSGTDALFIALKQLQIGPGDEVIIPSHTAVATAAAVIMTGAKPVYVDIDPEFYTIDPEKVFEACTINTKAVIAVHIYGQPSDMDRLTEVANLKKIKLIEDCAQSVGPSYSNKKLGSFGDVGCFSFFPTKNLGALGDGGCIVCNDLDLAEKMKRFRQYGWNNKRKTLSPGINSRLDELQAAVLRVKLENLDKDILERNRQAKFYSTKLSNSNILVPKIRKNSYHSFHLYVIQTNKRRQLMEFFSSNNIGTALHYPLPIHQMAGYASEVNLPVTEKLYSKILSLPLFPGLLENEQSKVVSYILNFIEAKS